jgi:hypothetical protein
MGTRSGYYSVKSGYHYISQQARNHKPGQSNRQVNQRAWNRIWKIKVPPRYQVVIWRILNDAMPVRMFLIQRGVQCPIFCPICLRHAKQSIIFSKSVCGMWMEQYCFGSQLNINFNIQMLEVSKTGFCICFKTQTMIP